VECSNAPAELVAREASSRDLVILGVQRLHRRRKLLGRFTLEIARKTCCPLIIISRRG
jgi:nucleotide-binding universal stress UspA family protein